MAVTRRTDIAEFVDDITLTVAPLNGGAVGINEPNPTRGTFQIEDTYVFDIDPSPSGIGKGNFSNTLGGQENNSTTVAQYYREGSRVYMDGRLVQTGTWNITDWDLTLPVGYRPLKTERFYVVCILLVE